MSCSRGRSEKAFYIYDHPLLPTPYNHRFFVEKFATGFRRHGYEVKRITRASEVERPGFVMISNHDVTDWIISKRFVGTAASLSLREGILSQSVRRLASEMRYGEVSRLSESAAQSGATIIAWFWNESASFFDALPSETIFTGEYFFDRPATDKHGWFDFYQRRSDALPIKFAASNLLVREAPVPIRDRPIDVAYVGAAHYKPDWYANFAGGRANRVVATPPYISETERLSIYQNSKVVLGLHSETNVLNHVVVERVYEALAAGAVCVSDHPDAPRATDGVALHVGSAQEMLGSVEQLLSRPSSLEERSARGVDFASRSGNYGSRAREFIGWKEG